MEDLIDMMQAQGAAPQQHEGAQALADEPPAAPEPAHEEEDALIQEDRVWQGQGWTARVIKNEDDDGWAVAMIKDGEPEPALVGPWTMGRDKKNPKPLDTPAFHTLVKTANEVIRRHEQQLHARLHKSVRVVLDDGAAITVKLVITPDEDEPYATLTAIDEYGEQQASVRTRPDFRLSATSATEWIEGGYRKPR